MQLTTDRLLIRLFSLEDQHFVFELLSSVSWRQHIEGQGPLTIDDARNFITERILSSYQRHGFGPYTVVLKSTNQPIGLVGIYQRSYLPYPDLGCAMLSDFQRKGYTYEASLAVLKYADEELGLHKVLAFTKAENTAARRLLAKLNYQEVDTFYAEEEQLHFVLYEAAQ